MGKDRPTSRKDSGAPRRCAIYTRVSTDSGLEQDFNSLDSQREACDAYVRSQAQEGWRLIRDRFDDGGFSGGSIDRPALQKLLEEIRARRIDVVVVYKVDRLTRSLADFAKLVELFDAHEVSFISVTQAFNTTTSMGRLTLNMLLSFAQFEREITGERIRDKVAASKRKGIWMGGAVPLGYRVENRALHVVEAEADVVQMLFRRYLELGGVVRLKAALDAEAIVSPVRVSRSGRAMGGRSMSRGCLYGILSNPIYLGRLRHKGQIHEGLHSAIIEPETWETAQQRLRAQTASRRDPQPDLHSFLVGKLFDDKGNRMGASFACKGAKRYRYYISRPTLIGEGQRSGSIGRIAATDLEREVIRTVERHILARADGMRHRDPSGAAGSALSRTSALVSRSPSTGHLLPGAEARDAIERVTVGSAGIEILLSESSVAEGESRNLALPWAPTRSRRKRDIIRVAEASLSPSRAMRAKARSYFIEATRDARRFLDELLCDPSLTIEAIAARERKSTRSLRMTLSLALLAPDLVKAAMEGRLPRGLNVKRMVELPMLWSDQWKALGLQPPPAISSVGPAAIVQIEAPDAAN
jgi:DNA invertase Pin-like site-specific DNA recombinase